MGKFALLIGNSRFADGRLPALLAPMDDVEAFKAVLKDADIAGFDSAVVATNHDLEAVRADIIDLLDERKADDLVLIYYTGHGITDIHGDLYLALANSTANKPAAKSLEAKFLRERLDKCAARRQILILDCCHSGAAVAGGKDSGVRPALANTPLDPEGFGCFVLASSAANQVSIEMDGVSYFTKYLVEGLREGKAAPDKQKISISDLAQYTKECLRINGVPMQPQYSPGNDELFIARNPRYAPPIDPQIIAMLEDISDVHHRLWAVGELVGLARKDESVHLRKGIAKILSERKKKEKHTDVWDAIDRGLEEIEVQQNPPAIPKGPIIRNPPPLPPPTPPSVFWIFLKYFGLSVAGVLILLVASCVLLLAVAS